MVNTGTGYAWLLVRHQAITLTNIDVISVRHLEINFGRISIKIQKFFFLTHWPLGDVAVILQMKF